VREEIADRADLEAARADEGEVPRPRLRDRLVEDPRGVVERLVDGRRIVREPGPEQRAHALVELGFLGAEPVEGAPGLGDQLDGVLERLLARRVEPKRPIGIRHAVDATLARSSRALSPPASHG
jgi:hypothetical protein